MAQKLLSRLFGRSESSLGDLATGDWAPLPPSALAAPADTLGWLVEDAPRVAREPVTATGRFSPEELAVIEEQQRAQTARMSTSAVAVEPAAEPLPAEPAEPRPSWIDVLRSYAEHLTDAELRIIRQQFATNM